MIFVKARVRNIVVLFFKHYTHFLNYNYYYCNGPCSVSNFKDDNSNAVLRLAFNPWLPDVPQRHGLQILGYFCFTIIIFVTIIYYYFLLIILVNSTNMFLKHRYILKHKVST